MKQIEHLSIPDNMGSVDLRKKIVLLLRGTIVNKTYVTQQKNYIFTYFYQQYLVLFTLVPRISNRLAKLSFRHGCQLPLGELEGAMMRF